MDSDIFVINLPDRVDRRREMEDELARIGWRAIFFPAVRPTSADGFDSVGTRGCFLSHLAVLKLASKQSVRRLTIIEDDADFRPDFVSRWPKIASALETRTWSIAYLGHILEGRGDELAELVPELPVQCTHFMQFNGQALPRIAGELELMLARKPGHPLGGPMHVDGAYSTIRMQNTDLKTLAVMPSLARQRPSRTDIGATKWFDRVGAIRPAVSAARFVKRHLTR